MWKMFLAITTDIMSFFHAYASQGCLIAITVTGCYLLYEIYRKRVSFEGAELEYKVCRKALIRKIVCLFLLVFYLYMVIGITILSRNESGVRRASFELFRTFRNTFFAKKQIYENVIMFVPYAVLLYNLAPIFRKLRICLLFGAGSSLLIEVVQWITRTGYFEVDDILTNTIGMLLGYALCRLGGKIAAQL